MPIEENVRIAIDSFNRFRRPDAEARLINAEDNTVTVEFIGSGDINGYTNHFREKLEDIFHSGVEIRSKRGNSVSFSIADVGDKSRDSTERALSIIDKYYDGSANIKLGEC